MPPGGSLTGQFFVEQRQVDMQVRVERIGRERAAIVDQGEVVLGPLFQHIREIEIRFDVIGSETQTSLERVTRFLTLALVVSHGAEVAVGIGIIRGQFDRRLIRFDGLIPATRIHIEFAPPFEEGKCARSGVGVIDGPMRVGQIRHRETLVLIREFQQELPARLFEPPLAPNDEPIRTFVPKPQCRRGIVHPR